MVTPTWHSGLARSPGESDAPDMWRDLMTAWMPIFGPTGTMLFDVSPWHINGTFGSGSIGWVISRDQLESGWAIDGAANLGGISASVAAQPWIDNTDPITVYLVARSKAAVTVFDYLFNLQITSGQVSGQIMTVFYAANSNNSLRVHSGLGALSRQPDSDFDETIWHRFTFVKQSGSINAPLIYIDGIDRSGNTVGTTGRFGDNEISIGKGLFGVYDGDVEIADCRVWRRAFTPREVTELNRNPLKMFQRNVVMVKSPDAGPLQTPISATLTNTGNRDVSLTDSGSRETELTDAGNRDVDLTNAGNREVTVANDGIYTVEIS